jgi:hypothetical protein
MGQKLGRGIAVGVLPGARHHRLEGEADGLARCDLGRVRLWRRITQGADGVGARTPAEADTPDGIVAANAPRCSNSNGRLWAWWRASPLATYSSM